jgi:hypothetical protein
MPPRATGPNSRSRGGTMDFDLQDIQRDQLSFTDGSVDKGNRRVRKRTELASDSRSPPPPTVTKKSKPTISKPSAAPDVPWDILQLFSSADISNDIPTKSTPTTKVRASFTRSHVFVLCFLA